MPQPAQTPFLMSQRGYLADHARGNEIRREILARWALVWRDAGIKLADEPHGEKTRFPRTQPVSSIAIPPGFVLYPGDPVVLLDGPVPGDDNQHMRRVLSTEPGIAPGYAVALLGEPLPRSEWPAELREATVPSGLAVAVDGHAVEIVDTLGERVASISARHDTVAVAAHVAEFVRSLARLGRSDGLLGEERFFGIKAGIGGGDLGGRRSWQIVDSRGTVHEAVSRHVLNYRAPAALDQMLAVALRAYSDGRSEALLPAATMDGRPEQEDAPPAPRF